MDPITLFWLVACSLASAVAGLGVLSWVSLRQTDGTRSIFGVDERDAVFLFDEETLIDASDSARTILAASMLEGGAWARLTAFVEPRFPGFTERIADLAVAGRMIFTEVTARESEAEPLLLKAEWRAGLRRITLVDPERGPRTVTLDHLSHRAAEEELTVLRDTVEHSPMLVWRETEEGAVVWANRAYLLLAAAVGGEEQALTWPLPRLFDSATAAGGEARRLRLMLPGSKKPRWFDGFCRNETRGRLHFAVPADTTVQAEAALREFVQTLTKTFAHLSIGLAIFDRHRQLALFNPALMDLTGIGPEFLSSRPGLFAFLDRLREERTMPEPKDYKSWRHQMSALERAASSGQYEEIWTLPSGQTYRVIGRPHPDGAVALLFEDISAEISLTRRFRAELEVGQAVLDAMPEAVAVFSSAGVLVMSNAAYVRLWGVDPMSTLVQMGVGDALRHWQARGLAPAICTLARGFVANVADRAAWTGPAQLADGTQVICRLASLSGGNALIGFTLASDPGVDALLRLGTPQPA